MVSCLEVILESGCAWAPNCAEAIATVCGGKGFVESLTPYCEVIMTSIFG